MQTTRTDFRIPNTTLMIGDHVRDELTGFAGILTTHQRHLTGCDTAWVTSKTEVHEGQSVARSFDIGRLTLVEANPLGLERTPKSEVPAAG